MSFDDYTNPQLVVLAVAQLGGDTDFVDREDIAIQVNEVAPGRFVWRKYPDRIDLCAVHFALQDARKARYGELLVGDKHGGWMLSPAGVKWINSLDISSIGERVETKNRRHSTAANLEAERVRLRTTNAYRLSSLGSLDQVTVQDFYEFARVNEYFQTKARLRRYSVVNNAVVGDEVLSKLWKWLKEKFPKEIE